MSITYKDVSRLPGLQISLSNLVIGMVLLLAGCIAGVPLKTEKPSDHFNVKYVETHQRSTKQEVVNELGGPEVIFRSKDKTYYVYDATGDTRMIVGAVFIVPPFFVPFWTPKEEGDALHCFALIFDERGLLQESVAETASEEAWGGLLLPPQPGAWPWGEEVTECGKVLWNEKELAQLKLVAKEDEIQSLETATPSERLSLWAYAVFGATAEGYEWLCRSADQGGAESWLQLASLFYNEGHRLRNNYVQAFVWYSLADTVDNSVREVRMNILEKLLSDEELQEARRQVDSWKPNGCMKSLEEGGLLNNRKPEQSPEAAIEPKVVTSPNLTVSPPTKLCPEMQTICRRADQGNPHAQVEIGNLYRYGLNIDSYGLERAQKDLMRAYVWYSLAAEGGYKGKIWDSWRLEEVREDMSPNKLQEAQDKRVATSYMVSSHFARLCKFNDRDRIALVYPAC